MKMKDKKFDISCFSRLLCSLTVSHTKNPIELVRIMTEPFWIKRIFTDNSDLKDAFFTLNKLILFEKKPPSKCGYFDLQCQNAINFTPSVIWNEAIAVKRGRL